jgi:isopentenyl phosphate kinase
MHLVKLGGSVITDKSRPLTFRPGIARALARELAPSAGRGLVVVHGAGSFGHPGVNTFGLRKGLEGPRQLRGAAAVQWDVRDLDLRVVGALLDAGVPAVSIPPGAFLELEDGRLARFDAVPFQRALNRGFVPVTFGDVLPDTERGVGIVSGDALMAALAAALTPDVSVFVTAEDGVYDRDPSLKGARLLPEVSPSNAPRAGRRARGGAADVTGAMGGKLVEAFEVAAHSGRTWVVGGRPGVLRAALAGKDPRGTRVMAMPCTEVRQ